MRFHLATGTRCRPGAYEQAAAFFYFLPLLLAVHDRRAAAQENAPFVTRGSSRDGVVPSCAKYGCPSRATSTHALIIGDDDQHFREYVNRC